MDELTKNQLATLQQQLCNNKAELLEQLAISEAAAGIVTLDQTSVGRVSRIDAMQQQSMAVSTRHKAKHKLLSIESALRAFDQDDYGFCSQCDETIAYGRLLAQPEAKLCIGCQTKADDLA